MRRLTYILLLACLLTACRGALVTIQKTPPATLRVEMQPGTPTDSPTLVPTVTPTPYSGPWQLVAVHNVHQNVMAAGFLTEDYGITAGTATGVMFTTTDGGQHWYEGTNQSDCRYGVDIVDTRVGWTSGGAMNVHRSTDNGANWLPVTDYGLGTNHQTFPHHQLPGRRHRLDCQPVHVRLHPGRRHYLVRRAAPGGFE